MSETQEDSENSNMTSDERKSKYRDLLDKVEIIQENEETGLETTNIIDKILENANILFQESNIKERIKHTDEVLLDAKVVAIASDVLLHVTESIDCTLDHYEHTDLAQRINSQFLNDDDMDELDYSKLAVIAARILNPAPNFKCIYGDGEIGKLEVEKKPEKQNKPRSQREKREQFVAKKNPEKVTEVSKEEDTVDETVKFLHWALNKECEESNKNQIEYNSFVFDPDDFYLTVENMFYLSFLVRDGRAKLNQDKNGIKLITPVSGHDAKKAKKNAVKYKQCAISVDPDEWQRMQTSVLETNLLSKWKKKWDLRKKEGDC